MMHWNIVLEWRIGGASGKIILWSCFPWVHFQEDCSNICAGSPEATRTMTHSIDTLFQTSIECIELIGKGCVVTSNFITSLCSSLEHASLATMCRCHVVSVKLQLDLQLSLGVPDVFTWISCTDRNNLTLAPQAWAALRNQSHSSTKLLVRYHSDWLQSLRWS